MNSIKLKPIEEHSYSFVDGFFLGFIMPDSEEGMRQIDWKTVKQLAESKEFDQIEVGLAEDWACTHAVVYRNGHFVIEENKEAGFYGASKWATPAAKLYKNGKSHLYECWIKGNNPSFPEWLIKVANLKESEDLK